MTRKQRLEIYLERTVALHQQWQIVNKKQVNLDIFATDKRSKYTVNDLVNENECHVVACLGGWAYLWARRDGRIQKGQLGSAAIQKYYGEYVEGAFWEYGMIEPLFDVRKDRSVSHWEEANNRLQTRIDTLRQLLETL